MTREERAITNLKQICSDGRYLGSGSYAPLEVLEDFKVAIKALEQEPRKGHWIKHPQGNQCSICKLFDYNKWLDKYCPNCGADMREVDK